MEFRKMVMITLYAKQKKRQRCTEQTFGLCGRRQGWDVSKEQHVYYLGWNRSPAQVGCMRQVLGPGALGRPRGIGWRGRWEGGSGWVIHVTPWLIHVNVWQNPLKCCEVISLQLIKKKESTWQWRRHKRHWFDPQVGKVPREGNGNPLQYSCLEKPMDRGASRVTVQRVTKSWTWLKQISMHTHAHFSLTRGLPRWH